MASALAIRLNIRGDRASGARLQLRILESLPFMEIGSSLLQTLTHYVKSRSELSVLHAFRLGEDMMKKRAVTLIAIRAASAASMLVRKADAGGASTLERPNLSTLCFVRILVHVTGRRQWCSD